MDVEAQGFFEFDNIGSPAPGNATSAPGGGANLPGGGTNNVIGRRLAYGYQVQERSFTDPGGSGGTVMFMTTPTGKTFSLVSNSPTPTPQRRQLVAAQVVELLDSLRQSVAGDRPVICRAANAGDDHPVGAPDGDGA